jgi:hypothetical protein
MLMEDWTFMKNLSHETFGAFVPNFCSYSETGFPLKQV